MVKSLQGKKQIELTKEINRHKGSGDGGTYGQVVRVPCMERRRPPHVAQRRVVTRPVEEVRR